MTDQPTLDPLTRQRFRSLHRLVGNTPLLAIDVTCKGLPRVVYAKVESLNLTGSIKDRMALRMIEDAEQKVPVRSFPRQKKYSTETKTRHKASVCDDVVGSDSTGYKELLGIVQTQVDIGSDITLDSYLTNLPQCLHKKNLDARFKMLDMKADSVVFSELPPLGGWDIHQDPPKDILKHLCQKHDGEVRLITQGWMDSDGHPPPNACFFHEQFTITRRQYLANRRLPTYGKWGPKLSHGDTTHAYEPNPDGTGYRYRVGKVIGLGEMLSAFGDAFSANAIYELYCVLPVFICKRSHSDSSEVRRKCALERYKNNGYWGWGRS